VARGRGGAVVTRPGGGRGAARLAWAIAGGALALRLVLIALAPGPPELFEHEAIVRNLLEGRGFTLEHWGTTYHTFQSYLPYLALNFVVCALTGHDHAVLLVAQSVITAATVLLVFRIGAVLFDARVGAVAALLTATHPGLLLYDTRKLHTLGTDALLIVSAVWLTMSLAARPSLRRRLATGVVIGLAFLSRGTIVAFAAVAPLVIGRGHRRSPVAAVLFAVPVFAGMVLAVGPWLARNYAVHHTLVVQTPSGEHFWRGNHAGATGTGYTRDGRYPLEDDPALHARILGLDELGQMRAYTDAAVRFWRTSPGEGVALFLRKLLYFFTVTPTMGLLYPRWQLDVYLAYYAVVLALALVGTWALARRPAAPGMPPAARWLPLFAIVSIGVVQASFYVEIRHRWGVEPLMLILTAAGLEQLRGAVRRKEPLCPLSPSASS
jgi:4-amino-4-deoxy-L-arabinose transferase-like glycosyltransferase